MSLPPAIFTVSLDLELHWGVFDHTSTAAFAQRSARTRVAIPRLLSLFEAYEFGATWATIGALMHRTGDSLRDAWPFSNPLYDDSALDPTPLARSVSAGHAAEEHLGGDLVDAVLAAPRQELGTHTFAHFCCDEDGATPERFDEDLSAAAETAKTLGVSLKSLVFPRNQVRGWALNVARDHGVSSYRGTANHAAYRSGRGSKQTPQVRAFRLVDSVLPLSGHGEQVVSLDDSGLINVPASRFFRPFSGGRPGAMLHTRRVCSDIDRVAKSGGLYHLWWHPHNMGGDTDLFIECTTRVMDRVDHWRKQGRLHTMTMGEVAESF